MAKKKMTLEEKLEEAIVKDAPYEVSENWVWTKVGTILKVSSGKGLTAKEMNDEGSIPVYGGNGITGYHDKAIYDTSKLIIGRVGAQCGNVHITSFPCWITDNALVVEYQKKNINEKYLYYILKELNLGSYSTSSAQPVISGGKIYKIAIPLPPLKEQQRIVDRIESLFEKLDKAKELIEEARDDFEKRKSAILEKAFRGELTKEYRKKFSLDINKWKKAKLSDFTEIISGNAFKSKDFIEKVEIKCVKITNVGVGYYEDENTYLPNTFIDEFSRFKVKKNDILVSLTRSYINAGLKVCLYPYENYALLNQRVALIRYDNYKYLYYYLRTNKVLDYVKEKSKTTNQPNLSIKELQSMEVPIPSSKEQNEIVRILDKLFEDEYRIEGLTSLEEQIELIKKSILAKAFRGQLGTNCEEDESALELLKEILSK